MPKKCEDCGREIDDKWDVCYKCDQKRKEKSGETAESRQNSIERQVAAKCVARALQGHDPTDESITKCFNVFMKLIRG